MNQKLSPVAPIIGISLLVGAVGYFVFVSAPEPGLKAQEIKGKQELPKVGMMLIPPGPHGEASPPFDTDEYERFINRQWEKIFKHYETDKNAQPLWLFMNIDKSYFESPWPGKIKTLIDKLKKEPRFSPGLVLAGDLEIKELIEVVDKFMPLGFKAVLLEEFLVYQTGDHPGAKKRGKCDAIKDIHKVIKHLRTKYPDVLIFAAETTGIFLDLLKKGKCDKCGVSYPYFNGDVVGITNFDPLLPDQTLTLEEFKKGRPKADEYKKEWNKVKSLVRDYGKKTVIFPQTGNWYPQGGEALKFFKEMNETGEIDFFILITRIGFDRWDYEEPGGPSNFFLENQDDTDFQGPFYNEWHLPAREYIQKLNPSGKGVEW